MKKIIFAAAIILFAASCKKSSDTTGVPAGIHFTLDGATMTLNGARAVKSNSGTIYTLQLYGYIGTTGASNELIGQIQAQSPITATTYTEEGTTDVAGLGYFIYPSGTAYANNHSATNPATITITSLTSTNVQGTFKGDIFNGADKKVIANGTFNMNF